MPTGARRFALQQLDRAAQQRPAEVPQATITAVSAGAAPDGNALVTVDYHGATLNLPYLAHYTPAVGHRVALVRVGGVWTIFGRPIGHPTSP